MEHERGCSNHPGNTWANWLRFVRNGKLAGLFEESLDQGN